MKYIRLLTIAAAIALATSFGIRPEITHAGNSPAEAVVESSQSFCQDPTQTCTDAAHSYNLGYEEATSVNFSNSADTTPNAGVFVCARAFKTSTGGVHFDVARAFPGYDRGWISGRMFISNGATETTKRATGGMYINAYDADTNVYAIAQGTQQTNNATDLPLSGTITLRMRGTIREEDTSGSLVRTYQGVIGCTIQLPYVVGGAAGPPDSESVISDTDSD